jgi:bifunctional UDP-N-acetylglucosamine pyrophosphorylase/glucosamine-1-phosphate N-acetyltransferase
MPKVLHEVCGRPMLAYVIDACRHARVPDCIVIVGYGKDTVIQEFRDEPGLHWVEQREQKGTGHAVLCARNEIAGKFDDVLILCGDGPLIRPSTIEELLDRHTAEKAVATLATAVIDDPTGYGRIVRDGQGNLSGIVEHRDCTVEQREIREVNPSYYCYRTAELLTALGKVRPDNAKGEYYLTDTLSIMIKGGQKVQAITAVPPEDIFSINSRKDLALVNRVMRDRINDCLMASGVTIVDPESTWIDSRATIGQDTIIHPFVCISGPAKIGRNCTIGPFVQLAGGASVEDGAVVGPSPGVCA